MKPDYARHYRELYERHWWFRAREVVLLEELKRNAPAHGWGNILDVGCGDALFFDKLERLGNVWGVEPDGDLVSANNRHRPHIHICAFDSGFTPGRTYRLILMLDVLEHMSDPESALRHAKTLLEPGGRLLATVPAFRVLWTSHDDYNAHVDRYTIPRFRDLVARGGFEMLSARYLFHWLFPAKLAVRAMESIAPGRSAPARIPNPRVNNLLRRLSIAEWRLLGHVPVPFGTSVIAWSRAAEAHRVAE